MTPSFFLAETTIFILRKVLFFCWFLKQQLSYVRAVGVRQEIQISIISRKMTWKSPTVTLIIKTEKIMIKIKLLIIYPNSLFHCYVYNCKAKYDWKELTSLFQKCHFTMSFTLKFKFLLSCLLLRALTGHDSVCVCVVPCQGTEFICILQLIFMGTPTLNLERLQQHL